MSGQAPLLPTFKGHISTTMDALILFEACLLGRLNHVPRRPHDRERQELITSGNIFIYEEHASGIKRWTDGVSWSPSRILGNFLIYRELEKPFPPGEKKRALKKKKVSQGINKSDSRSNSTLSSVIDPATISKDPERSLVGSLVDSYPFKNQGLVKKTISITFRGVPHHLVSYYNVDDVLNGSLVTPTDFHGFRDCPPRSELIMSQNFRNPLDEMTTFGQDERAFMPPGAQPFYNMPPHVPDFASHQAVITQALPMSGISVSGTPVGSSMPAYSLGLDYEFLREQEAQAQAQAQVHHHHHQFQHQHQLHQQQLHQQQLHQQQLHQQQLQQQQLHQQQLQQQQLQLQQPPHQQHDEQQNQYHQQRQQQQSQEQQNANGYTQPPWYPSDPSDPSEPYFFDG